MNYILFMHTFTKKELKLSKLNEVLRNTKIGKKLKIKYCISYIKYMRSMKREYECTELFAFLIHLRSLKKNEKEWNYIKCLVCQTSAYTIDNLEVGHKYLQNYIKSNTSLGYWNLEILRRRYIWKDSKCK